MRAGLLETALVDTGATRERAREIVGQLGERVAVEPLADLMREAVALLSQAPQR
jgi:hypothetical protein